MTALSEYQRLEASGLWRPSPDAQRCDVIVSIGDATLTITDMRDRALAHWSLPAIERANPGKRPAIYHPDGDPGETLELAESEADVIAAIEKLRAEIERQRPHPGRLRLVMFALSLTAVAVLAVVWLPGAARQHAVSVVPDVKRAEIGQALLSHVRQVTGPPCRDSGGARVLAQLAHRLPAPGGSGKLIVVRNGVKGAIHLPGDTIVLSRSLVEDFEEPDVVAGYIVAERLRAQVQDPLEALLSYSGLWSSFRLLTTGALEDEALQAYAKHLLIKPAQKLDNNVLLAGFKAWSVRSTPFAYAEDISGETTIGLIEADPFVGAAPEAVLSDANWLQLQGICGG